MFPVSLKQDEDRTTTQLTLTCDDQRWPKGGQPHRKVSPAIAQLMACAGLPTVAEMQDDEEDGKAETKGSNVNVCAGGEKNKGCK